MCAVFGLIDYGKCFSAKQREKILRVLSKECEERGTDATGFAFNKTEHLTVYKRPLAAHRLRLRLPNEANIILGHTRMATQGNKELNFNNHPFKGKAGDMPFALAHNGVIYNDHILRLDKNLPNTSIGTDSYIAVQLLEQHEALTPEAVADMAEQIEGSFVFTILDRCNNSYFVKGDNPLALYHFEKYGFYIYASTDKILTGALRKLGLHKLDHTDIAAECGEILQIDWNGTLTRYSFNTANIDDWEYRCFMNRHTRWGGASSVSCDDTVAIKQLKEFAKNVGVDEYAIDMLLEYGYTTDDIEDMFYVHGGIELAIMEITGDCCEI